MAIQAGETTFYQAQRGIVQDGLILNLDAAVDESYITGSTWRDLSNNKKDALLINGPSLNKEKGGNLTLDGTNQFIRINDDDSFDGLS